MLSTTIDELMTEWDLEPAGDLPLSINWVGRVRRADGSGAVLKLAVPGGGHLNDEATALEFFDGRGAVRVLARDRERNALLLDEARPGNQLRDVVPAKDEDATAALITVMRGLHRPAPDGIALPELSDRAAKFTACPPRLPRRLVERAGRLWTQLCASATERVVLHGDLHHDNVLAAESGWLAIDPHGVVGDPGYEVGAMLYNPFGSLADDTVLDLVPARIEQLADGLGMPAERVAAWGFVQAVLSEIWTLEDGGVVTGRPLLLAERLLPHLP
ncbi:aminoglycoside phosphotransferase family protein [Actinoplanes rectilineatus]|uniref:aminoglycoside phosphotransferase family protein n=1 Tax=Actinoplanes rectilineatus TaxID=113571 RepID=UPI0005F2ECCA|nr:aminoglycoside phosphotransferase family protein [Actinoplanes rectilineatus]